MLIAFLAAAALNPPKATAIDPASWFSPDDYPKEAAKGGIEGDSAFEADVDAHGKPTACRITHSSGSPILDQKTCDIVVKKGQFKPAISHGKSVAGRYSQTARWRLEGMKGDASGYVAAVIDYSKDPGDPTCSVVSSGLSAGPTCQEALRKYGADGSAQKLAKLVALMSVTTGNGKPYRGEPDWGPRVAFVAIDLYPSKEGAKAACAVVAKEGGGLDVESVRSNMPTPPHSPKRKKEMPRRRTSNSPCSECGSKRRVRANARAGNPLQRFTAAFEGHAIAPGVSALEVTRDVLQYRGA